MASPASQTLTSVGLEEHAHPIRRDAARLNGIQEQGSARQTLGIADALAVKNFHALTLHAKKSRVGSRDRLFLSMGHNATATCAAVIKGRSQ